MNTRQQLLDAEQKTKQLFNLVETRGLIAAGKTERQLSEEITQLAKDEFGVNTHWGKKIVRAGLNTLLPYIGDGPDQIIKEDDIVFFDFHPVFEGWEADLARTYVLGSDPLKLKLRKDIEEAWYIANDWYFKQTSLSGAELFKYCAALAKQYGYEFGNPISGHIIDYYPHEQPADPADLCFDAHPDNHQDILQKDNNGNDRHWMLELHFVDRKNKIGGFFEQLLDASY